MTREKDDPEKRNLLNEPREEKKRRQYSGSRNKADRRSCESSSSEHRKRGTSYKISSTEPRTEIHNKATSQIMPFLSDKKDSWRFWQSDPPKKTEDSCSCVSCALKKIVSSEYACIGCLLLIFTISIIVAFLVVFKNVPNIGGDCKILECRDCHDSKTGTGPATPKCKEYKGVVDSERLKRKIENLSKKRMKKGFIGVNEFRKNDNKGYDDVLSGHIGIPGIAGIDFGPSFRQLTPASLAPQSLSNPWTFPTPSSRNYVDEPGRRHSKDIDLSNVLDPENMDSIQNSEKLRDFYKKLVQTDAKIKSLKKLNQDESAYVEDDVIKLPERSRRSLKLYRYPKRYRVLRQRRSLSGKQQKANETSVAKKKFSNQTRLKRHNNEGDEPTGIIIEKKKILVQYKPAGKRRIPVKKCQHAPAGTHTHEKQMMHPFYKNTQKLDMLLDKFLNKNLPEMMSDPFGLDELFKHEKPIKACKHPKPHKNVNIISDERPVGQIPKPKFKFKKVKNDKVVQTTSDLFKLFKPESTTEYERDFFDHEVTMMGKQKKKIVTASPNDFEVLLSVSTIMNPDLKKVTKAIRLDEPKTLTIDKVPNMRRLMQLEAGEDEENLGYEDFKEVLTDDMDNHDETEKSGDRKKRDDDPPELPQKYQKFNLPQTVHNPNWKGAMPLYPDEINSMITNKAEHSKTTDEIQELLAEKRKGRDLSDIEYVEDYLSNKYDRLVQQAQAYSDYGVLDGKKEFRNEKDSPTADRVTSHKIKLLADNNFNKAGLLRRLKRGRIPRAVKSIAGDVKRQNEYINEIEVTTAGQPKSQVADQPKPRVPSEGLRIEMVPTTKTRDDLVVNNFDTLMKIVSKHVKLKPNDIGKIANLGPHYIHSTLITKLPKEGFIYSTKTAELVTEATTDKNLDGLERERELLSAITRGNRRLLSTGFESSSDFRDYKDSFGYRRGNTERNRSSIDRFVQKLYSNDNLNTVDEKALRNYIERVKQMNIKIYSTAGPYNSNSLLSESHYTTSEESKPITDPIKVLKGPVDVPKIDADLSLHSEVTINKSLVNIDMGDSYSGKILLTVKDPEFGAQNFNLIFDVPLVMNFNEELMMMNDNVNYPNYYSKYEMYNDSTVDPQVSDVESYPDHSSEQLVENETVGKRIKRETNVTATWSDSIETKEYTRKDNNVAENTETKLFKKKDENVTENSYEHASGTVVSYIPMDSSSVSVVPVVTVKVISSERSDSGNATLRSRCTDASLPLSDNMTLSQFFGFVANWFKSLEYGKRYKPTRNTNGSSLTDLLLTISNTTNESDISSTDSAYPMYDSDMIENIGHRSRVLLSVEDIVTNVTEESKVVISTNATKVTAASTVDEGNVSNRTTSTRTMPGLKSNITTTETSLGKKTFHTPKKSNKTKLKLIVKRNADDSNLIFWNDIYDDEYGIQTDKMGIFMKDKFDDAVRDTQSVKEKDFIKKSGRWVQNKIRKFARNLKINPHSNVASVHSDSEENKERVPRSIRHDMYHGILQNPRANDRDGGQVGKHEKDERDEIEEDYPDVDQKSLFAALSVNMKEVCKKAAKAVQETRNMDLLHDNLKTSGTIYESKQGSVANALMQQLVRLLTELVDYQVQQKTCTKLPPELQTFLEWLTYSKEETDESESQSNLLLKGSNQEDKEFIDDLRDMVEDKTEVPDEIKVKGKQNTGEESVSRYQDNRYSIQNLLDEYDDLTDDEKSKMLGVKDYLERQLEFLNQQLSAYDLHKFFDIKRKKRDIYILKQNKTKQRHRRRPHKFIKVFGKKHTRTTAGYHDEAQITDIVMNRKTIENQGTMYSVPDISELKLKLTKRNLQDVYYKAVADAKKFSSAKITHKKYDSRSESSTAK